MKAIWDLWARRYDTLWAQKVSLGPTRAKIIARLREIAKGRDSCRVLDMGCGTGQLYGDIIASELGGIVEYCGVDRSEGMIAVARAKHPDADWRVADVAGFDSGGRRYDAVVCAHSFPYYDDKQTQLYRLFDLVLPGGDLLLAQACQNNFYDFCVLSLVKLTTSKAQYLSRSQMTALAGSRLGAPDIERINPARLMPSLDLFHWKKKA